MSNRNRYRVDVVNSAHVPVGMNSIKYLGISDREAGKVFEATPTGFDQWNQPNPFYGVILSVWDGSGYVIKRRKGFDQVVLRDLIAVVEFEDGSGPLEQVFPHQGVTSLFDNNVIPGSREMTAKEIFDKYPAYVREGGGVTKVSWKWGN